MTDNMAILSVIGIVALSWVIVRIVGEVADVLLVKHGSITTVPTGVYDLYEFTNYLDEKGALREGFGQDHLIEDYIHANHVD